MEQEAKIVPGYYELRGAALIKLIAIQDQFLVQVIAVSHRVPKGSRELLLTDHFKGTIFSPAYIIVDPINVEAWRPTRILESEVETIKLLYNSDQSAEGTTVEASTANSTVSDAKIGGGQNGISKS